MSREDTPWVVAIGASGAQGLGDIEALVGALPSDLAAIVLIVLHRPWNRPTHLQAVLSRASALPVLITRDDERFKVGRIYIGEPDEHLSLAANSFGDLIKDPGQKYRNRTVDLLFKSVAAHAGSRMIGVILSGLLDDGSRGLAAIREAGGITMVLSPAGPPAERGMRENAIAFDGPVDLIGSAGQIAQQIQDLIAPTRQVADPWDKPPTIPSGR